MTNPISLLRRLGLAEAISFLLLVGVAMPLKYFLHQPLAVRIFGLLHGLLFVAFCAALLYAWRATRWPLSRAALIFVAALLPFGPFFIDRRLRSDEESFRART